MGRGLRIGHSVLPAWAPALGTVADVSLNTLADVGGDSAIASTTRSWGGMAHAPWWGDLGRFINYGGGHSNGRDNDLWCYDVATRLFSKIKDRYYPTYLVDNYVADPVTGWHFANAEGTELAVGEPFTSHFYSFPIAIPPEALAGASNGWLLTPGRGSMAEGGQLSTGQSHKIALGDQLWSLHGTPLLRGPAHGCSIYDKVRNRVIAFSDSQASAQSVHPYIDIATEAVGTITLSNQVMPWYAIGAHHEAADCYMLASYRSATLMLKVIDATTNQVYTPTISGTAPVETNEGAFDWAEDWNAWIYYPGVGGNNIYTLKCNGSNPRTDGFTWAKQTVTGTARSIVSTQGEGLPFNRLRMCARLGTITGVVHWLPDYTVPVQAFHISAP